MNKSIIMKTAVILAFMLLSGCKPAGTGVTTTTQTVTQTSAQTIQESTESKETSKVTETTAAVQEEETPEWELVWADEFDGEELDRNIWSFEEGYIRNNELQYYTDRTENIRLEDGNLIIEARKEAYKDYEYTSGSINTKGTKTFLYGKIEMRAKLPFGKGIWPAFWTKGVEGSWPTCGEIDIMEMVGGGKGYDDTIHGYIHWDSEGHQQTGGYKKLPSGKIFADDYHVIGIEWDKEKIRWFLDGKKFQERAITDESMSEFHQEHWLLLNLAVGGNWPGSPNFKTEFPQKYYIDWVRVYQEKK